MDGSVIIQVICYRCYFVTFLMVMFLFLESYRCMATFVVSKRKQHSKNESRNILRYPELLLHIVIIFSYVVNSTMTSLTTFSKIPCLGKIINKLKYVERKPTCKLSDERVSVYSKRYNLLFLKRDLRNILSCQSLTLSKPMGSSY